MKMGLYFNGFCDGATSDRIKKEMTFGW